MKSWIHEISKKYIEQRINIRKDLHEDYLKLNKNKKFNLLISNVVSYMQEQLQVICKIDYNLLNETQFRSIFNRLLKEASNTFNAGNAMGGDGGDVGSSVSSESGEKPSKSKPPRKPRAPRTDKQKTNRNAADRARRERCREQMKASATGGDGGSAKGGTVGNVNQNAADITGNDNVNVQGQGNVTSVDKRSIQINKNTRIIRRGSRGSGGPKPVYRVEKRLNNVIGPVTRGITLLRGVGSGLDTMMGGAGGVLQGAEQIGTSLTPRTLRQRQSASIFGNLTPQQKKQLQGLSQKEISDILSGKTKM